MIRSKLVTYFLIIFTIGLIGCTGSGSSALIGKWGEDHNVVFEFFKDGSAIVEGWKYNWTATENGQLTLTKEGRKNVETYDYKFLGSILVIDGYEYKKIK